MKAPPLPWPLGWMALADGAVRCCHASLVELCLDMAFVDAQNRLSGDRPRQERVDRAAGVRPRCLEFHRRQELLPLVSRGEVEHLSAVQREGSDADQGFVRERSRIQRLDHRNVRRRC
jgi:hypothetical protein